MRNKKQAGLFPLPVSNSKSSKSWCPDNLYVPDQQALLTFMKMTRECVIMLFESIAYNIYKSSEDVLTLFQDNPYILLRRVSNLNIKHFQNDTKHEAVITT
jgi:hypothetical protein